MHMQRFVGGLDVIWCSTALANVGFTPHLPNTRCNAARLPRNANYDVYVSELKKHYH